MPRLPTMRVIGSHDMSTRFGSARSAPLRCWVAVIGVLLVVRLALIAALIAALIDRSARAPRRSPRRSVAGLDLLSGNAPLRFLVDGLRGDAPQLPDEVAVGAAGQCRDGAARRLVHERHELVRETRHRAADADAADVRAAADAVDPSALRHVALDDGTPAAQLDDALRRAVLRREVALLVVARAVAAFVDGGPEQPGRAQRLVERD